MSGDRAIRLARDLLVACGWSWCWIWGQMNGDGYQLLHQLKRDRRTVDVPVVGPSEPRRWRAAGMAGCDEVPAGIRFVAKPFSMEQLVADISAVVNAHSVVKEF